MEIIRLTSQGLRVGVGCWMEIIRLISQGLRVGVGWR